MVGMSGAPRLLTTDVTMQRKTRTGTSTRRLLPSADVFR
jgi:hypothetical protein